MEIMLLSEFLQLLISIGGGLGVFEGRGDKKNGTDPFIYENKNAIQLLRGLPMFCF